MVYHIRRADNHEERSIHKDDMEGLEMAIREACFRTYVKQIAHEVVDDDGKVIHVVSVRTEVEPPPVVEAPKPAWRNDWFWVSAWFVAMLIFILVRP